MVQDTSLGALQVNAPSGEPVQDVAEAVLYLGLSANLTRMYPSAFVFRDDDYWNELNRRWLAIYGEPFNLSKSGFDLRGRLMEVTRPILAGPLPRRPGSPKVESPKLDSPATELHPRDAIAGILETLNHFPMVALGDVHMGLEFHTFVQRFIRDPRLPGKVQDFIVEFGNPRYQSIIDRYVLDGEPVPREERKPAWQLAAIGWFVANSPVYEQFFDTVREVNLGLPRAKRIRVVLGDMALNPEQIRGNADESLLKSASSTSAATPLRDVALAASVNQVLAQGHRAIMICGNGHLRLGSNRNARTLIEQANPGKFYLIDPIGPSNSSWPAPSVVVDSKEPDQTHATLWLGLAPTEQTGVRPSPLIYRDPEYWTIINLFEQTLSLRRTPLDLADPIFEYRARYFEAPSKLGPQTP